MEDWRSSLSKYFKSNQSDDISISLTTIGFKDFFSMKDSYKERFSFINKEITNLYSSSQEISALEHSLNEIIIENEKVKARTINYENKINDAIKESTHLQNNIHDIESQISNAERVINDKKLEIDRIREDIIKCISELQRLSSNFISIKDKLGELKNEFQLFKKENLIKETETIQSKIELLKKDRIRQYKDLWLRHKPIYEKHLKVNEDRGIN